MHWMDNMLNHFHLNSYLNNKLQFHYIDILGGTRKVTIKLNKNDAGRMLFFPSLLLHQVYPFYTSDETRISISGNLSVNIDNIGENL